MDQKTKNLGEPWIQDICKVTGECLIKDKHGNDIARIYEVSIWHRIKAESEALAGCPDPVAFMAVVKRLVSHADILADLMPSMKTSAVHQTSQDPALAWLREEAP